MSDPRYTFEINRVNERRMQRGAEGVEIRGLENGKTVGLLWMSAKDIRANIKEFGPCQAFTTALAIYKAGRDIRRKTAIPPSDTITLPANREKESTHYFVPAI